MEIKVHPLFYEPEIQSILFVFTNLFGIFGLLLIYGQWPLSTLWTLIYLIFVFLINHALSCGSSYLAVKNLNGQTVVITGAASGIGRVCAIRLAKLGARVIIGVRGQERAEKVAKELCEESNGGNVIGYDLDISSLRNVEAFAEKIDCVNILINNAGALFSVFRLSTDGIELQFATNHLGHFYLTKLLLNRLNDGRVINISSLAHRFCNREIIDYTFGRFKTKYNSLEAYSFSKLAQIYHASELHRRYKLKAYSLHPGTIINTNLNQRQPLAARIVVKMLVFFSKTLEQGALTTLYCALSDDAQSGAYHSDCQIREPSSLALDAHLAEQCWQESERLIAEKIK